MSLGVAHRGPARHPAKIRIGGAAANEILTSTAAVAADVSLIGPYLSPPRTAALDGR